MESLIETLKIALLNKDFFTTIILLFVIFGAIIPILNKIIEKLLKKFDTMSDNVQKLGDKMLNAFKDHEVKDTRYLERIFESIESHNQRSAKQYVNMTLKMGNTALNEEQTVDLLLKSMWFVSYGKLQFIKNIMTFDYLLGRKEEITNRVRSELLVRSEEYIKDFKQYLTPIGDLSDWLSNNFGPKEFDEFLTKIIEIIYSDKLNNIESLNKEGIIELKVNEIATLMKTVQTKLGIKLREDMKNFNK